MKREHRSVDQINDERKIISIISERFGHQLVAEAAESAGLVGDDIQRLLNSDEQNNSNHSGNNHSSKCMDDQNSKYHSSNDENFNSDDRGKEKSISGLPMDGDADHIYEIEQNKNHLEGNGKKKRSVKKKGGKRRDNKDDVHEEGTNKSDKKTGMYESNQSAQGVRDYSKDGQIGQQEQSNSRRCGVKDSLHELNNSRIDDIKVSYIDSHSNRDDHGRSHSPYHHSKSADRTQKSDQIRFGMELTQSDQGGRLKQKTSNEGSGSVRLTKKKCAKPSSSDISIGGTGGSQTAPKLTSRDYHDQMFSPAIQNRNRSTDIATDVNKNDAENVEPWNDERGDLSQSITPLSQHSPLTDFNESPKFSPYRYIQARMSQSSQSTVPLHNVIPPEFKDQPSVMGFGTTSSFGTSPSENLKYARSDRVQSDVTSPILSNTSSPTPQWTSTSVLSRPSILPKYSTVPTYSFVPKYYLVPNPPLIHQFNNTPTPCLQSPSPQPRLNEFRKSIADDAKQQSTQPTSSSYNPGPPQKCEESPTPNLNYRNERFGSPRRNVSSISKLPPLPNDRIPETRIRPRPSTCEGVPNLTLPSQLGGSPENKNDPLFSHNERKLMSSHHCMLSFPSAKTTGHTQHASDFGKSNSPISEMLSRPRGHDIDQSKSLHSSPPPLVPFQSHIPDFSRRQTDVCERIGKLDHTVECPMAEESTIDKRLSGQIMFEQIVDEIGQRGDEIREPHFNRTEWMDILSDDISSAESLTNILKRVRKSQNNENNDHRIMTDSETSEFCHEDLSNLIIADHSGSEYYGSMVGGVLNVPTCDTSNQSVSTVADQASLFQNSITFMNPSHFPFNFGGTISDGQTLAPIDTPALQQNNGLETPVHVDSARRHNASFPNDSPIIFSQFDISKVQKSIGQSVSFFSSY